MHEQSAAPCFCLVPLLRIFLMACNRWCPAMATQCLVCSVYLNALSQMLFDEGGHSMSLGFEQ